MNILRKLLFASLISITFFNCKNEAKPEIKNIEISSETSKKLDPNATYVKTEFTIDGMTCEMGCAKTIEKKIAKMEGVKSATVDFKNKLAMVEYNEAKVTTSSLKNTVTNVGDVYKVSNIKTVKTFSSEKATTCSSKCKENCAAKSEKERKACVEMCKKAHCSSEKKA